MRAEFFFLFGILIVLGSSVLDIEESKAQEVQKWGC